jgi:four helix bundle protein
MQLPHHNLVAWQRADDLFIKIHVFSRSLPPYERYELGSQMRRAALSVPANIVEAYGRRTNRDRAHFLQIASASLGEVGYFLHAARRLGYLSDSAYADLETDVKKAAAPLRGLIDSYNLARSESYLPFCLPARLASPAYLPSSIWRSAF